MNSLTNLKKGTRVSNPSVLLLSGGIESSTLLHDKRAEPLHALFMNYGQRAAQVEAAAAAWQCEATGVPLTTLDLHAVGDTFRAQRAEKWHVPLPHRNLVALGLAVSFAAQIRAPRVYIALNREDAEAYPSGGGKFLEIFRHLTATLDPITIDAPYADLTKSEVVALGRRLGVDYSRTYSCLLGHPEPCGRCDQCRKRAAALA